MTTYLMRGRITPDRRLEVVLPPNAAVGEAEVIVNVDDSVPGSYPIGFAAGLLALLDEWEKLPPIGRTAEEIEAAIEDARNSWD